MSKPLRTDDPAYWMLERGIDETTGARPETNWVTQANPSIFRESCYICIDPEFALMGLPLCRPCPTCGGHMPADDVECENGHNFDTFDPETD